MTYLKRGIFLEPRKHVYEAHFRGYASKSMQHGIRKGKFDFYSKIPASMADLYARYL